MLDPRRWEVTLKSHLYHHKFARLKVSKLVCKMLIQYMKKIICCTGIFVKHLLVMKLDFSLTTPTYTFFLYDPRCQELGSFSGILSTECANFNLFLSNISDWVTSIFLLYVFFVYIQYRYYTQEITHALSTNGTCNREPREMFKPE